MESFVFEFGGYDLTIFIRLVIASTLGGLIGLEREVHGRPAGFRTHLLVSIGACLMMVVSEYFWFKYGDLDSDSILRLDPARVAAQIVTGIGFLGAGVILKDGQAVRGLTTAACLWVAAGIGMSVGAGLYSPALLVTAIALFNLLFLKRLGRVLDKDTYQRLTVHCDNAGDRQQTLRSILKESRIQIVHTSLDQDIANNETRYDFVLACTGDTINDALLRRIALDVGATRIALR